MQTLKPSLSDLYRQVVTGGEKAVVAGAGSSEVVRRSEAGLYCLSLRSEIAPLPLLAIVGAK